MQKLLQLKLITKDISSYLLVCLILFPLTIYFGTFLSSLLLYFLYIILFNIIPGTLLYLILNGKQQLPAGLPVIGWVVGLCLEVSIYHFLDRFGLLVLFNYYPFIVILTWITLSKHSQTKLPLGNSAYFSPSFLLALIIPIFFIAIQAFTPVIDEHFAAQAKTANIIIDGWPYESALIDGMPFFYNYLIHTHIAAASIFTGLKTLELTSRLVPLFLAILCLSTLYFFSINHYKTKWVGILVIMQIFGVIGRQYIQTKFLGSAIPSASIYVLSTMAAFPVFFVLVSESFKFFKQKIFSLSRLFLIILLLLAISGIRTPGLIALGTGFGFIIVWELVKNRHFSYRVTLIWALTVLIFATSLILFYGLLSPLTATKFLTFIDNPANSLPEAALLRILQEIGFSSYFSGAVTILVIIIGQF